MLLAAIKRADHGAFTCFVRRHLNAVHAYAYRLSGSRADADDIAQDTFLKIWQKAQTYKQGQVKPTTWLHRVAHNTFIDLLRKRKPTESIEDWSPKAPDIDPDAGLLERAMTQLPLNQRTAVALCLIGNHTTRDAAHIMGLNARAVESLIARARRSLKEVISRDE